MKLFRNVFSVEKINVLNAWLQHPRVFSFVALVIKSSIRSIKRKRGYRLRLRLLFVFVDVFFGCGLGCLYGFAFRRRHGGCFHLGFVFRDDLDRCFAEHAHGDEGADFAPKAVDAGTHGDEFDDGLMTRRHFDIFDDNGRPAGFRRRLAVVLVAGVRVFTFFFRIAVLSSRVVVSVIRFAVILGVGGFRLLQLFRFGRVFVRRSILFDG